jgi:2-polyprenyl-6-methoxyphenol hydroxylase-like FAD-dependent oxidoreductase
VPDQQSQTGVLIVGGGYAGLASAVFLSAHGVPCILADRHPPALLSNLQYLDIKLLTEGTGK